MPARLLGPSSTVAEVCDLRGADVDGAVSPLRRVRHRAAAYADLRGGGSGLTGLRAPTQPAGA